MFFFTVAAGTKDFLEQQTAKKFPGTLSDSRVAGNFSSPKQPGALLGTGSIFIPRWNLYVLLHQILNRILISLNHIAGVQRKLDLLNQVRTLSSFPAPSRREIKENNVKMILIFSYCYRFS